MRLLSFQLFGKLFLGENMKFKWLEPSEKEIESAVLGYLNFQPGCFAFKVETKASWDPKRKRFLSLPKGVLAGTPDILCCLSVKNLPIFIAIECKTRIGRQSPSQIEFQEIIKRKANGFYFVVRSIQDVETAVKNVKDLVSSAWK